MAIVGTITDGLTLMLTAVGAISLLVGGTIPLLSVGVSGSIGLIFGVLPARRAARLDPTVALQSQ